MRMIQKYVKHKFMILTSINDLFWQKKRVQKMGGSCGSSHPNSAGATIRNSLEGRYSTNLW